MNKFIGLIAVSLILASTSLSSRADTLLIERRDAAEANPHPGRGELMAKVESRFGPPLHRVGPVGEPPITRWVRPSAPCCTSRMG